MPTCDPPDQADLDQCCCVNSYGQCTSSPILIDINGDGFNLCNVGNGVDFDLNNDGVKERLSWTTIASDDAWLAIDRNGNGRIDSGAELFGNYTPQSALGLGKNGFTALADFDKSDHGGNNDGLIDENDTVFALLRLWQDANHNGTCEVSELRSLAEVKLSSIELAYKRAPRVDEYGNRFRYRSKVKDQKDSKVGRWAWDIFLVQG